MLFWKKSLGSVVGISLLMILLISSGAMATSPSKLQTFQVFFENDLFGNTDQYYTNAVQLTWLSHDLKQYRDDDRLPGWSHPIIRGIIRAFPLSEQEGSTHNIGLLLGQQIYTPSDIEATAPQETDRPYAGFLYGGIALHSKTDFILDTLEIVFGIVGSDARAEFAQNSVHDLRNISTAKGWDNQLRDEPAIRFSWQRQWRLHTEKLMQGLEYDLISHAGVTLGNVRVSANAGGEVRLGYHIPKDFGSDVIRAGAGVSAPVTQSDDSKKALVGAHLFASSRIEAVAHDIFLDGNTWKDSGSVDKKPFVADLSLGLALSYGTAKLTYRHLFRTKQFYGQKQDQIIGSLTLTYAF